MEWTRRTALAAGIVGLAARPGLATDSATSLDAIARRSGRRFGSAVAWSPPGADAGSFANPAYARLVNAECGLIVPENEMKWQALCPAPGEYRFAHFDAMMVWAAQHGLAVRGHNLLWHQNMWLPRWLATHDFGPAPWVAGAKLLTDHVERVAGRYAGRIASFDVVNEAVRPSDGALYATTLSDAIGGPGATLDLAFHVARRAAPRAELVYNDFMGWEPADSAHRAGVLRLLAGFRRRETPVDALGLQSHLITQRAPAAAGLAAKQREWQAFLQAVTGMGYRLLITELDVRDNGLPADPAVRDRAVADYARAYLDTSLAFPQLRDVLCWGLTDRYSWIDGFEPRRDGARRRPTLYDRDLQPKPLRAAVTAAFAAAPARSAVA